MSVADARSLVTDIQVTVDDVLGMLNTVKFWTDTFNGLLLEAAGSSGTLMPESMSNLQAILVSGVEDLSSATEKFKVAQLATERIIDQLNEI